jgi:hypothetical protein
MKAKIKGDPGIVNIKPAAGSTTLVPAAAVADSNNVDKDAMPYKQLTMRPVLLKGKVVLQVSLLTARQVSHVSTLLLLFLVACSTHKPDIAHMRAWVSAGKWNQQQQQQQHSSRVQTDHQCFCSPNAAIHAMICHQANDSAAV